LKGKIVSEAHNHSPLHQFEISKIVELSAGSFNISFTNSSLWMMIAVISSIVLLSMAMSKKAVIPGRMQIMAEMLYEFVANMVRENIGSEGRKYFPFVFTVFMIVIMGNMLGMLPYSFTYTSHIAVTGILALAVFLMVTLFGIAKHGLSFFSLFCPSGVPLYLLPLIIPIEILSFLVRPVTLAVRLCANMIAGHMILKVFAGFCVGLLGLGGVVGVVASVFPMLFNVLMIGFEFFIAFIQAYVFTILTCIYLKDSVELHH
jgi:F-type H+-transporting ATPase subunit a